MNELVFSFLLYLNQWFKIKGNKDVVRPHVMMDNTTNSAFLHVNILVLEQLQLQSFAVQTNIMNLGYVHRDENRVTNGIYIHKLVAFFHPQYRIQSA